MSETLYATFSDPNRARKAVEDLVAQGVNDAEISLLVKSLKEATDGVDLEDTRTTIPMRGTEFFNSPDPLGNQLRQNSVARIERGVDVELNPVQRDMDKSAPTDTGDQSKADRIISERRERESLESTPYEDMPDPSHSLRFSRGFNGLSEDSPEHIMVDPDADAYRDTDSQVRSDATGHDVVHGVATGAGIGLGFGAAAAIATLLIPGFGMVIGAGALASAAAALATGVGVGAVAGGITSLLKEQGIPAESVERYNSTYQKGGAIVAVTVTNPEMRIAIEETLRGNGATELETHQAYLS